MYDSLALTHEKLASTSGVVGLLVNYFTTWLARVSVCVCV